MKLDISPGRLTSARRVPGGRLWRSFDTHRKTLSLALLFAVASLAVVMVFATIRGQDFNWDQQNYHIGIPFLLLHGTFWSSVTPAGVQSYFNPYLIELDYLLLRNVPPIAFALIIAAVQSLAFVLAGLVCVQIVRPAEPRGVPFLALTGFALCLMAPMPLSEAGSTYIDLTTAPLVIAAYLLLLTRGRWLGLASSAALAGALLGAATALKLTNAVYAIGVVGFALAGPERFRARLGWLVLSGATAIVAFVAVTGRWQLALWRRFGDPFFPYYNNFFHSPDTSAVVGQDTRFLPHSFWAIWRYPLDWMTGASPRAGLGSVSAEVPFTDVRWIIAIGGLTLFIVALLVFRRWSRDRLTDRTTGFLFAVAIAYLVWLAEFGYQRYIAALGVLCGAALLALVIQLPRRWARLALAAVAVVSLVTMRVPNWERLPWRSYWQSINPKPLAFAGPSIVFLPHPTRPVLFIAASLPPNTRYVGLGDFDLDANHHTALTAEVRRMLNGPRADRLKVVFRGSGPMALPAVLRSYGLRLTSRCEPLQVAVRKFRICDLARP